MHLRCKVFLKVVLTVYLSTSLSSTAKSTTESTLYQHTPENEIQKIYNCTQDNECEGWGVCDTPNRICICPREQPIFVPESDKKCLKDLKLGEKCEYDAQCAKYTKAKCDLAQGKTCQCENDHTAMDGQVTCFPRVDLSEVCTFSEQCTMGKCTTEACTCTSSNKCQYVNEKTVISVAGMEQVVIVVIGCIAISTLACVITILYRRFFEPKLAVSCVRPQNSMIARTPLASDPTAETVSVTGLPPKDDTPPEYDVVVLEHEKSHPVVSQETCTDDGCSEPPTYVEYIAHVRHSLKPVLEPSLHVNINMARITPKVQAYDNESFTISERL